MDIFYDFNFYIFNYSDKCTGDILAYFHSVGYLCVSQFCKIDWNEVT